MGVLVVREFSSAKMDDDDPHPLGSPGPRLPSRLSVPDEKKAVLVRV